MRLAHLNGTPDQRWRWVKIPNHKGAEVEVYIPTTSELNRISQRFKVLDPKHADHDGLREWIAQRWFRQFRGMFDAQGKDITNSEENRRAILDAPVVFQAISDSLADGSVWRDEGNENSGSAS